MWNAKYPLDGSIYWDLAALFGAVPEGKGPTMSSGVINAGAFNQHIQVFETTKWAELVAAVMKCAEDKVPLIVSMALKVLPNHAQGVEGGYDAEVVFVFNSMPDLWHDALPQDSIAKLQELKKQEGFPAISTTKIDYDSDLAIYLSQLASYNMVQALPVINNMLSK